MNYWNFKVISLVLFLSVFSILSGCTSKIPGVPFGESHASYCLQTKYIKKYHETVKWSSFDYGRYKKRSAGGGGTLCGLTEFHTLHATWETNEGVLREENVDVVPLINELNRTQNVGKGGIYGKPNLRVKIIDKTLFLEYIVMTKKGKNVIYSLYSSNKNKH